MWQIILLICYGGTMLSLIAQRYQSQGEICCFAVWEPCGNWPLRARMLTNWVPSQPLCRWKEVLVKDNPRSNSFSTQQTFFSCISCFVHSRITLSVERWRPLANRVLEVCHSFESWVLCNAVFHMEMCLFQFQSLVPNSVVTCYKRDTGCIDFYVVIKRAYSVFVWSSFSRVNSKISTRGLYLY